MLDEGQVDDLRQKLVDKFTPEELLEIIRNEFVIGTGAVFDVFKDECLEIDWGEYL